MTPVSYLLRLFKVKAATKNPKTATHCQMDVCAKAPLMSSMIEFLTSLFMFSVMLLITSYLILATWSTLTEKDYEDFINQQITLQLDERLKCACGDSK